MLRRPVTGLYADASVLINLIGTDVAPEILRSVGVPVFIVRPAADEVVRDPRKKSTGRERLEELAQAGVLQIVELGFSQLERYIELIGAPQPDDLGDGEAATICMAEGAGGAVVLDDAKAIRVSALRCPELQQLFTVDLLINACRTGALSIDDGQRALKDALKFSRMRVPHVRIKDLRTLSLLTD